MGMRSSGMEFRFKVKTCALTDTSGKAKPLVRDMKWTKSSLFISCYLLNKSFKAPSQYNLVIQVKTFSSSLSHLVGGERG